VNLNESLADERNQPTSFPTACSNKKSENPVKPKTQKTQWVWLFEKPRFFWTPFMCIDGENDNSHQSSFSNSIIYGAVIIAEPLWEFTRCGVVDCSSVLINRKHIYSNIYKTCSQKFTILRHWEERNWCKTVYRQFNSQHLRKIVCCSLVPVCHCSVSDESVCPTRLQQSTAALCARIDRLWPPLQTSAVSDSSPTALCAHTEWWLHLGPPIDTVCTTSTNYRSPLHPEDDQNSKRPLPPFEDDQNCFPSRKTGPGLCMTSAQEPNPIDYGFQMGPVVKSYKHHYCWLSYDKIWVLTSMPVSEVTGSVFSQVLLTWTDLSTIAGSSEVHASFSFGMISSLAVVTRRLFKTITWSTDLPKSVLFAICRIVSQRIQCIHFVSLEPHRILNWFKCRWRLHTFD